jgi:anti-anti-sigma factor
MEITTRTIGKCKVLDCSGKLTLGPATQALRKAIREAVQDDTVKVVLNLKDVPYVDISRFAEIISGYAHARNQGSNLVFLNPSEEFCKMVINAKLLTVIYTYNNEQEALEGCE